MGAKIAAQPEREEHYQRDEFQNNIAFHNVDDLVLRTLSLGAYSVEIVVRNPIEARRAIGAD